MVSRETSPQKSESLAEWKSAHSGYIFDSIVVGAGQAGLAAGYELRRRGIDFLLLLLLDSNPKPGGAWQH